ncbi:hypothetical protein P0Y35_15380 [Kiritimatiellaeota bacterium B1221]|nr:hypothetical protein [Kiritimatiellaeota bacterium B1221]
MFLETLKTGARHRFLCVGGVWLFLVICLSAIPVMSQIILDDAPEVSVEEKSTETDPEDVQATEKELNRIIENLQRRESQLIFSEEEAPGDSPALHLLKKQNALYESAPKSLIVSCELTSGETIWGELENQSFEVKNRAGVFPVLMHQLETFEGGRDKSAFLFRFSSGDLLWGVPGLDLLNVRLPDGGQRVLRLSDLTSVHFSMKQP